jgi:ankyrin repeat protein/poly(3-hydroxybutyrate) depolymerase
MIVSRALENSRRHARRVVASLAAIGAVSVGLSAQGPAGLTFDETIPPGANYDKAAFRLWAPSEVGAVRAVVVLVPGSNANGRPEAGDAAWQAFAARHHLALVACQFTDKRHDQPFIEEYANVSRGSGQALVHAVATLAAKSKHAEIASAPFLLWGMSAGGQFNYEFTVWRPERVLAFVVNKGGIYYTALAPRASRSVPGLFFTGEKDLWSRNDTLKGLFAVNRRAGALWALAEEPGAAHVVGRSREMAMMFFEDVLGLRLVTERAGALTTLAEKDGVLGNITTRRVIGPGDGGGAGAPTAWLPTDRVARAWEAMVTGRPFEKREAGGSPLDDRADLSLAIRQGNLAAVRSIVERNPGLVKSADDSGFTPLHIAATAGHVDIIEYLLDRGADLEARTAGGQTPLFQTVPLGSEQAFERLLEKGANLNARDDLGRTILQFALTWRRPSMVDVILQHGFNPDTSGVAAQQMLDEAANSGVESLVSTLIARGVTVEPGMRDGTSLLHSAARGGLPGLADRLLKRGALANARDQHGLTPLHLAAFHGRDAVVPVLLAAGADIEARAPDGRTARDLASLLGRTGTVGLLAARGAKAEPVVFPWLTGPYLGQSKPGLVPRLFAPGIVSAEEHETNIAFTPDGLELCVSGISADQTRRWIRFMRLENGRWTAPAPAPFASGGADFEASYAGGGRQLFFSSNRPLKKGDPPKRDMDVWVVGRADGAWGEPTNLGPAVNGESNEYMPSADREGNLYFERYGLNVARWQNGAYLPATRVDIAGAVNPGHPFVAPDGSYLLFDARPPGAGSAGQYGVLFVAFRLKDGTWSRAVRLFEATGARVYESCPNVSPDGQYLFFGRDDDIYWVSARVIDARRPGGQ